MNWYKISQKNYPKSLTGDEMVDFILNNSLKDWSGEINLNSAKEIAYASKQWELTELSLDLFDWVADPKFKNKQTNIPPIVLKIDNNSYDVLDGKHRIGMAKAKGNKSIQVYLGISDKLVETDWIDKLDNIQKIKNNGRGVSCVKTFIDYLRMDMIKEALAVYNNESDKIRSYPDINKMIKEKFGIKDVFDTIFKDKYE
jgi:hypothetical protein